MGFFACGASGEANTKAILEYDGGKNIHHAALAVSKFEPVGCKHHSVPKENVAAQQYGNKYLENK